MNDFSLSALPFKPESLGSSSVKVLTVHEVSVLSSLRWSQFDGGQPQLTDQLSRPPVTSGRYLAKRDETQQRRQQWGQCWINVMLFLQTVSYFK